MHYRRILKWYWPLVLVCLYLLFWLLQFLYFVYTPIIQGTETFHYEFRQGATIGDLARTLEQRGELHHRAYFMNLARFMGETRHLKAGYYAFHPGDSPWRIVRDLAKGKVETQTITLVDGWPLQKVLQVLASDPRLSHSPVLLSPQALSQALGLSNQYSLEGMLWPDTYSFYPGYSDLRLLKRSYQAMQNHLNILWTLRSPNLPYTSPYQALIMASLLEKETSSSVERRLIAGVLINRLDQQMRLQVDPTVIYALGDAYTGHLTHEDLKIDSPYNTYRHKGLPPTPIALSGLDAIMAALHPTHSDYLYFVARGDGYHQFSSTLEAHNQAVKLYLKTQ